MDFVAVGGICVYQTHFVFIYFSDLYQQASIFSCLLKFDIQVTVSSYLSESRLRNKNEKLGVIVK